MEEDQEDHGQRLQVQPALHPFLLKIIGDTVPPIYSNEIMIQQQQF